MNDVEDKLRKIVDPVPSDLAEWFAGEKSKRIVRDGAALPYALPLAKALKATREFRGFHPLIERLEGFALDDLEISDCHFYVCRLEIAGSVLLLRHDGDSKIAYRSLADYGQALPTPEFEERTIEEASETAVVLGDQAALRRLCEELLEDEEREALLPALIPSLDLLEVELLGRIARDENFFIVEALAAEIARRPDAALLPIAKLCAKHPHRQAADAGKRAVKASGKLK